MQTVRRICEIDAGHRVMNERVKCFSVHGHRLVFELVFGFNTIQDIGYQIDFKEIKRIGCQWIDDMLDHGFIANPKDDVMIEATQKLGSKLWLMSLNGKGEYCNPTSENISKEVFLAMALLFVDYKDLWVEKVICHETPNCSTETTKNSITEKELINFNDVRRLEIFEYSKQKGVFEYDDRKLK